ARDAIRAARRTEDRKENLHREVARASSEALGSSRAGAAPALEQGAHLGDRRMVGHEAAEALVVLDRALALARRLVAVGAPSERERRSRALADRVVEDLDAALRLSAA